MAQSMVKHIRAKDQDHFTVWWEHYQTQNDVSSLSRSLAFTIFMGGVHAMRRDRAKVPPKTAHEKQQSCERIRYVLNTQGAMTSYQLHEALPTLSTSQIAHYCLLMESKGWIERAGSVSRPYDKNLTTIWKFVAPPLKALSPAKPPLPLKNELEVEHDVWLEQVAAQRLQRQAFNR